MKAEVDWAHTDRARHDREVKARALAAAARGLGVPAAALAEYSEERPRVLAAAHLARASDETWFEACQLLAADPPASGPRPRACSVPGCSSDARLYLAGWRCDVHAPWAVDGGHEPVPPAGSTLADLRAARAARLAAESEHAAAERRVLAPMGASPAAVWQATRAQQAARRRGRRRT